MTLSSPLPGDAQFERPQGDQARPSILWLTGTNLLAGPFPWTEEPLSPAILVNGIETGTAPVWLLPLSPHGFRRLWHRFPRLLEPGCSVQLIDRSSGALLCPARTYSGNGTDPGPDWAHLLVQPDWIIERIHLRDDRVEVLGWFLSPPDAGKVSIRMNGIPLNIARFKTRADLAHSLKPLGLKERVFSFQGRGELPKGKCSALHFQFFIDGVPVSSPLADFWYPLDNRDVPLPDSQRRERVLGDPDVGLFHLRGRTHRERLAACLPPLGTGPGTTVRVLDWGCGCGNVARHLLNRPGLELFGADVDPDNISWCQSLLAGGTFGECPLRPPAPYPDGHFHAIFGISVLTHLDEDTQHLWLQELARLVHPEGYVLLSVLGLQAITKHASHLLLGDDAFSRGFLFLEQQHPIGRIIGNDAYYGLTYHDPQYIQDTWTAWFDLQAYIPGGFGHQDVVILRPRGAARRPFSFRSDPADEADVLAPSREAVPDEHKASDARPGNRTASAGDTSRVRGRRKKVSRIVEPGRQTVTAATVAAPPAVPSDSAPAAIRIDGVSKVYHLYDRKTDRLKEALFPWKRNLRRDFYALRDISLDVARGETVGVIGKNGSGKSTLLRIVAGIVAPTAGRVEVAGTLSTLLELGAGFNVELTGRENVMFLGSLLGFSRREMQDLWPSIEEFAQIGAFVHQPVKTYSSGMFVRLAFAAAVHVQPDVLVVDEVLAVGDIRFQQKCFRRIHEIRESGRTIMMVSHDPGSIRALCDRAVWLKDGQVAMFDKPELVTREYESYMHYDSGSTHQQCTVAGQEPDSRADWIDVAGMPSFGEGGAVIQGIRFRREGDARTLSSLEGGIPVVFSLDFHALARLDQPIAGFVMNDQHGVHVLGINTQILSQDPLRPLAKGERVRLDFHFRFPRLGNGRYSFSVAVGNGTLRSHVQHHWIHDVHVVTVAGPDPAASLGWYLVLEDATYAARFGRG